MEAGAIYVKIGAKLEPLDKAMRAVNTKLKVFEAKTAAVANRIERFANNTIKRTGLIAAALSGVGVVSVKMAGDFERAMVRVAAVSQATSRQFRELKEAALSYAGATEYNAKQVAEGMTFMAMAGFKAEQTIKAMPSVLQLATAGMIDLGAAADITTNILTGYGMATEDLAKVNDILVSAMTGANVDLRMLGESFKYAGPVAKGAGVAFEEAATAIALMGNAGIQGSMAGTALRTAISRLLNPTKSVEKLLRRLGVETKTAGGQLRSLTSIIGDLERAGATTADMMEIFGDRAGPAMAALVEQGAAAMAEFTARLRDSEGIAARIERDLLNTWPGQWDLLKGEIEGIAITLGDDLLPYMKVLVNLAGQLIGRFQGLDTEQRMQVLRWVGIAGAVVGVVAAFGLLVAGASLAMKGLTMLGGLLTILTSPWLAGGFLIAAIATTIYEAWNQDWGGLRTTIEGWADTINAKFEGLKTWWEESEFGRVVREAWSELVEVWTNDELTLPQKVLESVSIIANAIADLIPSIREIWDVWEDPDLDLKQKTLKTVSIIAEKVTGLIESIMTWWTGEALELVRRGATLLGLDPDKLWIVGFLEELNTIWADEDLSFSEKVVQSVALVAGEIVGLVESIISWWIGATISLARKVVELLGLDPEDNALVSFLEKLKAIWVDEKLTFGEKIIESIGLIPGPSSLQPFLEELRKLWIDEDLTLPEKVFETVKLVVKGLEVVWDTMFQDIDEKIFKPIREIVGTEANKEGRIMRDYFLADEATKTKMIDELRESIGETQIGPAPTTWEKFLRWLGLAKEKVLGATDAIKGGIDSVNESLDKMASNDKIARFIADIKPFAQKASAKTGLPWQYHAAQWGLETGWRIPQHLNLAGIKGAGTAGSVKMATREVIDGQDRVVRASFAAFESLDEFVDAYVDLLTSARYQAVLGAQTIEQYGDRLRKAGYATDPEYTLKLTGVYHSITGRGYASGTPWTGWGPTNEVAGVVHRREAVIPWEALRKGPAGVLEFLGVPGFQVGRGRGALRSVTAVDPNLAIDLERQQTMLDSLTRTLSAIPRLLLEGITRILNLLGNAVVFAVEKLFGEEKAQELRQFIANLSEEAKRLLEAFTHVGDEAEEVALKFGRLDSELREPMGPPLTGWQRFIKWLKEQGRQINQAFEEIDWRETIQVALNAVSAELQNSGNAVADAVGEMVSHIRLAFSETGEIVIDWVSTIQNALNSLVTMVLTSLTRLLFGDYGAEYRGLTKEGKETFPDLSAMITNYKNWDKNLETLKDLQRKIDRNTVIGAGVGAIAGFLIGGPVGAILGGLFGGTVARKTSQKSYEKDIANLQAKLGDTFQKIKETLSTTLSDIADSLARAFSAETFEDFVAQFSHNLEQQTKQALIMAFMAGEVMRPLLDKLSNVITMAVFDGLIDATERETIVSLYKDITDKASDFYESLKELGIATGDVADKMRSVGEALRNVPSGFKVALRRFGAAEPVPLAKGGIVTRPTLALVGESGPEAVIPLAGNAAGVTVKVTVNGSIYADDFEDRVARAVAKGSRRAGLGRYGLAGGRV